MTREEAQRQIGGYEKDFWGKFCDVYEHGLRTATLQNTDDKKACLIVPSADMKIDYVFVLDHIINNDGEDEFFEGESVTIPQSEGK